MLASATSEILGATRRGIADMRYRRFALRGDSPGRRNRRRIRTADGAVAVLNVQGPDASLCDVMRISEARFRLDSLFGPTVSAPTKAGILLARRSCSSCARSGSRNGGDVTLHLALEIDGDGAYPEAWRRAAQPPGELLTARRVARVAAVAENVDGIRERRAAHQQDQPEHLQEAQIHQQ